MSVESIAKTLGTGSGIDISALVTGLVDASFANKTAQLDRKSETLTAQISGIATLKSAIAGFSTALSSIARSGQISTQPTSSNTSILGVSLLPGATAPAGTTALEVRQVAQGQIAHSGLIADRTAPVGQGTLTIAFGTATVDNGAMTGFAAGGGTPFDVTIDASNSSLDGIAAAINARNSGVTASILSDVNGARLVMKGPTGQALAFEMTVAEDGAAPGLSQLAVGRGATGTTIGTPARDAIVAIDGIPVQRASNSISNLIPGLKLDLVSAAPGTNVTIGATPPTAALRTVVEDFVATFNDLSTMLREQTDPLTGALARDPAASAMKRSLAGITLAEVNTGGTPGAPTTLAAIGVATNRDGSLRVDTAVLTKALAEHPAAVEKLFAATGGIPAKLTEIQRAVVDSTSGLGASEVRYTKQKRDLSDQQTKTLEQAEAMRSRMTQQFASMDAKVAAYKSTQTFLEQQIDVWNAQRG